MSSIEPGQIYRECVPRDGRHRTRIVVKSVAPHGAGMYGAGTAVVATLTAIGREVRTRRISLSQLHESATTAAGHPRRTGYVLEADR